ncbi:MAG: polysaccharide deacetylase family protein, partial [Firmicutes bacterium]|nr:polysaccharide deacetylase family protein [Bacillota bacterium]
MSLKKYIRIFITVFLLVIGLFVGFNVVTDPFGVFGDPVMKWYDYDMTMNPRVAKIGYLDRHYGEYDSYILGSSKASSISVEDLNKYMDASFYNMTWYGGDLKDEEQLAEYITEHYNVKNLVLLVDPQDAVSYNFEEDKIKGNMHCKVDGSSKLKFYSRYLFANPSYGIDKIKSKRERGYLVTVKDVYVAETGCYNK